MKKLLPILLLTSLLLSACSIDWNDEKEKKIAELEKEIVELEQKQEDVIFEKNKECSKLEKEIWSQLNSSKTSEDDTIHLEVIFYSPIRKSCLYKTDVMYSSLGEVFDDLKITDFFTKEVIYSKTCRRGGTDSLNCNDSYEQKTKELKGE